MDREEVLKYLITNIKNNLKNFEGNLPDWHFILIERHIMSELKQILIDDKKMWICEFNLCFSEENDKLKNFIKDEISKVFDYLESKQY